MAGVVGQLYAGMPISSVFKEDIGIGGVISLLWFKRRLPDYGLRFIEMVLMLTADHGPAVSGAHNTIVSARAGKDLVSSLCSGLLTIVRTCACCARRRSPAPPSR
jgi:ATP citrate (pro-S)-lyase